MQYLPTLRRDGGEWRLPLSDRAALLLCEGLLASDTDEAEDRFAQAISGDPSLAIWALCRACRDGHSGPCSVPELSAWLALEAPAALQTADTRAADPLTPDARRRLGLLVDSATRVARLSARLAEAKALPWPLQSQAYLLGLTHNASSWLADPEVVQQSPRDPHGAAAPEWLRQPWAEQELPNGDDDPLPLVKKSLRALRRRTRLPARLGLNARPSNA